MVISERHKKAFFDKIKISENGCWEWYGMKDKDGYRRIKINRLPRRASRVAMLIKYETIPENSWVLHKCDNTSCVNPEHLYFGSPSQNSIDRENRKRGRPLIGENNGFNKLTNIDVLEIRKLLLIKTGRQIAEQYKVTPSLISLIKNKKIWSHI